VPSTVKTPPTQLGRVFHPTQVNVPPIKTLAKLKQKESRLGVSPRRPDIASWILSSAEVLNDMAEGSHPSFVWRRDIATGEWTEALRYASRQLLTSRTSVRIPFLREDLLPLVKNEGTCFPR
jgi:hypothetical protein